jgi:hypothetical protein
MDTYQPILLRVTDSSTNQEASYYLTREPTDDEMAEMSHKIVNSTSAYQLRELEDYLDELDIREINEPIEFYISVGKIPL